MSRSDKYNAAINSGVDEAKFIAQFGFTPEGAKENATTVAQGILENSKLSDLNNGINSMSQRWASFEGRGNNSRIVLDESFVFPSEEELGQTGLWLEAVSDDNGYFTNGEYPEFEYILDKEYDLIGFSIYFDDKCNEWPLQLNVSYYDNANALIESKDFENDSSMLSVEFTGLGIKKIVVKYLRWNVGARHAKTCQVNPGLYFVFDMDNVISFTYRERIYPFSSIQFPTAKLQFSNLDAKFDPSNPTGLVGFLAEGQMSVECNILVADEKILMCNFPLSAWSDSSNNDVAFFELQPSLSLKAGFYPELIDAGSQTVAEAAAIIMAGEKYSIEPGLENLVVNKYIGSEVTFSEAAGQLAIAVAGYWQIGRDNSYHLKKWALVDVIERTVSPNIQFAYPDFSREIKPTSGVECPYYTPSVVSGKISSEYTENLVGDDTGEIGNVSSMFIRDKATADAVGALYLEYKAQRVTISTKVQGDPKLAPMQKITISARYQDVNCNIESSELNFTGTDITNSIISGVSL